MPVRKFWDVDSPGVIVVAGVGDATSAVVSQIRSDAQFDVERYDEAAAALARLAEEPTVEALLLDGASLSGDPVELASAARDRDEYTAILYVAEDGGERLAATLGELGVEYLPADTAVDRLVERTVDCGERSLERRGDALEASVLESMLDELPMTIYAKDEQARHVLVSDRDDEEGVGPDTHYGKTDPECYPAAAPRLEASYENDRAVIERGERVDGEVKREFADSDVHTWTFKAPWRDGDDVRGLVGVTRDVTEWKRREQQLLGRLATLEGLPEYITHDLRNPLSIAKGYLDLAREGQPDALETVESSLDRIETLLEEFQALADQSASETSVDRHEVIPLVESVWEYVDQPGATLEIELPEGSTLVADETRIKPLFRNLLANAVTHAGPDVTVRVGALDDGFFVADDGPGIPLEQRETVFDQGFSTAETGTGIGLSIVQEAVRCHDWTLDLVESTDGGARFEVRGCRIGAPTDATPIGDPMPLEASTDVGAPRTAGSVRVPGLATGATDGDATGHGADGEAPEHEADGGAMHRAATDLLPVYDGPVGVRGAGDNVWGPVNEFHYLYATVEGDVRLEANVARMDEIAEYCKAGLMVRSGLDEDDAYGAVGRTGSGAPELLWRPEPGTLGKSDQLEEMAADHDWFRIERVGDSVGAWTSTDGEEWTMLDRRRIDLEESCYVGLLACSTRADTRMEAVFDDVSLRRLE